MCLEVARVLTFPDLQKAPVFAVEINAGGPRGHDIYAEALHEPVGEGVAHHGIVPVVAKVAQAQMAKVLQRRAVAEFCQGGKDRITDAVVPARGALRTDAETLLPERARGLPLDVEGDGLAELPHGRRLEPLHIRGALPCVAALSVIGRRMAGEHLPGVSGDIVIEDFAKHVDAGVVVEESRGRGGQADNGQAVCARAVAADKESLRAHRPVGRSSAEGARANDGGFPDFSRRWLPAVRVLIGRGGALDHAEHVRLAGLAADSERRSVGR